MSSFRSFTYFKNPVRFSLALAERLNTEPVLDKEIGSPLFWATEAIVHGVPVGSMHRLLPLGVNPSSLETVTITVDREKLLETDPSRTRAINTVGGRDKSVLGKMPVRLLLIETSLV